ncbi:unnamed protein product [Schistocephalus solidus]|uniref:Elongator complex protein 6 n=1 Tax=Schistocephalus solidus TaxID=70667 RepID=A0A183T3H8_SCHSO|nr:unnamed protein product [Schistocephalus solidus]
MPQLLQLTQNLESLEVCHSALRCELRTAYLAMKLLTLGQKQKLNCLYRPSASQHLSELQFMGKLPLDYVSQVPSDSCHIGGMLTKSAGAKSTSVVLIIHQSPNIRLTA